MWWNKIKHYYQRVTRGYSDRDLWSFDMYLARMIPKAIRQIDKEKLGIPGGDFLPFEHTEEQFSATVEEWHRILMKMAEGFDSYVQMVEMNYESELGDWPDTDKCFGPDGQYRPTPERQEYIQKMRPLMSRDEKTFEEGAALFVKYFGALWT